MFASKQGGELPSRGLGNQIEKWPTNRDTINAQYFAPQWEDEWLLEGGLLLGEIWSLINYKHPIINY